jgi:hypothetical protein
MSFVYLQFVIPSVPHGVKLLYDPTQAAPKSIIVSWSVVELIMMLFGEISPCIILLIKTIKMMLRRAGGEE